MIVVENKVAFKAMKPVRAWLIVQFSETLYLPSVTSVELLFGIAALPAGKRKDRVAQPLDGPMGLFSDRVWPFDADAARRHAELV